MAALNGLGKGTEACSADDAECLPDVESAEEITAAPLSNNTVACQMKDLAADWKAELISCLQICTLVLQMDKSIDVPGLAVLFLFIQRVEDLSRKCLEANTSDIETVKM